MSMLHAWLGMWPMKTSTLQFARKWRSAEPHTSNRTSLTLRPCKRQLSRQERIKAAVLLVRSCSPIADLQLSLSFDHRPSQSWGCHDADSGTSRHPHVLFIDGPLLLGVNPLYMIFAVFALVNEIACMPALCMKAAMNVLRQRFPGHGYTTSHPPKGP